MLDCSLSPLFDGSLPKAVRPYAGDPKFEVPNPKQILLHAERRQGVSLRALKRFSKRFSALSSARLTGVSQVSYYSGAASAAGTSMQISIGCDHAGFELKKKVKQFLQEADHQVHDEGAFNDEATDYPDFAASVAQTVSEGRSERGILICGTGIGMSITANKLARVRAALCHSVETARLSRQHNDSNVLAIGARVLETDLALAIVAEWLKTDFDGGRHQERLEKIKLLEDKGVTKVE